MYYSTKTSTRNFPMI